MNTCRIHITGASGAGVTTLGRALADALATSHHDTDEVLVALRPCSAPKI
jgi:shikimate kinase